MRGRGIGTARGRATIMRGMFLTFLSPLSIIYSFYAANGTSFHGFILLSTMLILYISFQLGGAVV